MNTKKTTIVGIALAMILGSSMNTMAEERYAENNGVRIHYQTAGQGPLVVMIHGFPDYSNTWRHLVPLLKADYRVAALDLRGYNLSDSPEGVENYAMPLLLDDIEAVIAAEGAEKAIIIGHDWGAGIGWELAINKPQLVDKLIALSTPHPKGFLRELISNAEQQANSEYARERMAEGAEDSMTAEALARWVKDPEAKSEYIAAFNRSDFAAMLNYYRANFPPGTGDDVGYTLPPDLPDVTSPVLVIHGLDDRSLLAAGHNNTWDWVDQDTTLVMIPNAGHFVQHDAKELVGSTIVSWLAQRR